jgi:hypothetical protein
MPSCGARLFNEQRDRMTPSHTNKKGVRCGDALQPARRSDIFDYRSIEAVA